MFFFFFKLFICYQVLNMPEDSVKGLKIQVQGSVEDKRMRSEVHENLKIMQNVE